MRLVLTDREPLRDARCQACDGSVPAADGVTVALLAQAPCRLEDVPAYLTNHGLLNADGGVRPAVDLERRLRLEAADHADAMGMSPLARARLGLDPVRGLEVATPLEPPADAAERSRRAAALLAEAGVVDAAVGVVHGSPVRRRSPDEHTGAPQN